MEKNGIRVSLRLVKVNNTQKKPGPVFVEMARAAYHAGANYFYRVNDDSEMLVNWAHLFVRTLEHLGSPYGVVGPRCDQGHTPILTHDFVHRAHMEIFDMNYYPPELSDWWMDDWISFVYGRNRTFMSHDAPIFHHVGAHGRRYAVNFTHGALLNDLILNGRKQIRAYMVKQHADEKTLAAFDGDLFQAKSFKFSDVPERVKVEVASYAGECVR